MGLSKKIKGKLLKFFTNKSSVDFDLKDTKKVIVFAYGRIGDMVITTPLFRELKKAYPNIYLAVLASPVNKDVIKYNPYVDKVYVNHEKNYLSDLPTLRDIRREKFDIAIELDHSVVPHAIIRLKIINPKKIISVYKYGRYGINGTELEMYDYYTIDNMDRHFKDIWLETLQPLNIKPNSSKFDLFLTQEQIHVAKSFLNKFNGKHIIGINLEGAIKGKEITYKDFEKICKDLYREFENIQIILLTSPQKYDVLEDVIKNMNLNYVTISYKTNSILDVAALIASLDMVITPDTSIVHIASAFDIPVISIHENNMHSFKLFSPTSSLNHTVFAKSEKGLVGYSVEDVVKYAGELIKKMDNK